MITAEEIRNCCKKFDEFIGPVTGGRYTAWVGKRIIALIHEDDDDVVIIKEKSTGATIYEHEKTRLVREAMEWNL